MLYARNTSEEFESSKNVVGGWGGEVGGQLDIHSVAVSGFLGPCQSV